MEEVILGVVVVVAVLVGFLIWRSTTRGARRLAARQDAEIEGALAAPRRIAEEDVTRFGEEIQRLDVGAGPLDDLARQDYARALDSYEHAKQSLAAVQSADDIAHVTEILTDGRYAAACLQARLAGEPLPAKRPPCFFDPAHGPSVADVSWSDPGRPARQVPSCAADLERIRAGGSPYIRTVPVGARRVPYWEAGREYAPWAQGWFADWKGTDVVRGIAVGSAVLGGLVVLPKLLEGLGDMVEDWDHGDLVDLGDLKELGKLKDLFD